MTFEFFFVIGGRRTMKNTTRMFLVVAMLAMSALFAFADPNGPDNLATGATSRYGGITSSGWEVNATAGNVTRLDINGSSITTGWAGFFGNVLNTILLGDNNNNTMFDWSSASPSGEVYASRASSLTWSDVYCANQTNILAEESTLNFGTSADGINETFTGTDATGFYIGTRQLINCASVNLHNSTGDNSGDWVENILQANSTGSIVYAAIVNQNAGGFDGNAYDFQMIVAEDGHSGDTTVTPYYFWVELE